MVGCSQSDSLASASAALPGYRLTIFLEVRLTWKVILPFSTVRVPLPSQASFAWNMLLSVSKSAVYTPSGRAAVSAAEDAAAEAASDEAALETAEEAVEEAPQPASRLSAREAVTTQERMRFMEIYLYLYKKLQKSGLL